MLFRIVNEMLRNIMKWYKRCDLSSFLMDGLTTSLWQAWTVNQLCGSPHQHNTLANSESSTAWCHCNHTQLLCSWTPRRLDLPHSTVTGAINDSASPKATVCYEIRNNTKYNTKWIWKILKIRDIPKIQNDGKPIWRHHAWYKTRIWIIQTKFRNAKPNLEFVNFVRKSIRNAIRKVSQIGKHTKYNRKQFNVFYAGLFERRA